MCILSFQANNLNPLFVPALTVEDVFRNTMAKLFSRRTEKKEDNGGEREASCVSCVVSKKCSGMLGSSLLQLGRTSHVSRFLVPKCNIQLVNLVQAYKEQISILRLTTMDTIG